MIQLVKRRLLVLMKRFLPDEVNVMKNYWHDYDISDYGKELPLSAPRNDVGGCSYFVSHQPKIANYPSIIIESDREVFSQNNNVYKHGFQYEEYNLDIFIIYARNKTETPDILVKLLERLTDSVINVIRGYPYLPNLDGKDPIASAVGISNVDHFRVLSDSNYFIRGSQISVVYKLTDEIRNRVYEI